LLTAYPNAGVRSAPPPHGGGLYGGHVMRIRKCVSGSCSNLASTSAAEMALTTDVFRLEASGSDLTCRVYTGWDYGTVKYTLTATDSTLATGPVGWVSTSAYGRGVDNWMGGDLNEAPAVAQGVQADNIYVSVTGAIGATGSISSPYNLWVLLPNFSTWVKDGGTVWLRGGTYSPDPEIHEPDSGKYFDFSRVGLTTTTKVKAYPGETPTLFLPGSTICGSHKSRLMGAVNLTSAYLSLEGVTVDSDTCRVTELVASNPPTKPPGMITSNANFQRLINVTARNGGDCMASNADAAYGNVVYGSIFEKCGWDSPNRVHGSATYNRNANAAYPMTFKSNITRDQHYEAFRFSGGSGALKGLRVSENISLGNPTQTFVGTANTVADMTDWQFSRNFLGSIWWYDQPTVDVSSITNNWLYSATSGINAPGRNQGFNGYAPSTPPSYTVTGNKIRMSAAGGNYTQPAPTTATIAYSDNAYFNADDWSLRAVNYTTYSNWASAVGETGATNSNANPTTNWVLVTPENEYEARRCNVAIANWESASSYSLDLSTCGYLTGEKYDVFDAWDLASGAFLTGTYSGSAISLPLNRTAYDAPSTPTGYGAQCWNTNRCAQCTADLGWQSGAADPVGSCTPGFTGASVYLQTTDNYQWYCNYAGTWTKNTDAALACSSHSTPSYARDSNIHVFVVRRHYDARPSTLQWRGAITDTVQAGYKKADGSYTWGDLPAHSMECSGAICQAQIPQAIGDAYWRINGGAAMKARAE